MAANGVHKPPNVKTDLRNRQRVYAIKKMIKFANRIGKKKITKIVRSISEKKKSQINERYEGERKRQQTRKVANEEGGVEESGRERFIEGRSGGGGSV